MRQVVNWLMVAVSLPNYKGNGDRSSVYSEKKIGEGTFFAKKGNINLSLQFKLCTRV